MQGGEKPLFKPIYLPDQNIYGNEICGIVLIRDIIDKIFITICRAAFLNLMINALHTHRERKKERPIRRTFKVTSTQNSVILGCCFNQTKRKEH